MKSEHQKQLSTSPVFNTKQIPQVKHPLSHFRIHLKRQQPSSNLPTFNKKTQQQTMYSTLVLASLLPFLTSAKPILPVSSRQANPSPFGLVAARSTSPIHLQTVNANGQRFWIGKDTATYCPISDCPPGTSTELVASDGVASMVRHIHVPFSITIFSRKTTILTKIPKHRTSRSPAANKFSSSRRANSPTPKPTPQTRTTAPSPPSPTTPLRTPRPAPSAPSPSTVTVSWPARTPRQERRRGWCLQRLCRGVSRMGMCPGEAWRSVWGSMRWRRLIRRTGAGRRRGNIFR